MSSDEIGRGDEGTEGVRSAGLSTTQEQSIPAEQMDEAEGMGLPESAGGVQGTLESQTQQSAVGEGGTRRTQLRIVRESVQSLSSDIGDLRRAHDATIKRLEGQVASLRRELAAHAHSNQLGDQVRGHVEASSKRLEKQVTSLRNDLAALKSSIVKESARTRAKQEATLSRILAKVSTARPSSPTRKKNTQSKSPKRKR